MLEPCDSVDSQFSFTCWLSAYITHIIGTSKCTGAILCFSWVCHWKLWRESPFSLFLTWWVKCHIWENVYFLNYFCIHASKSCTVADYCCSKTRLSRVLQSTVCLYCSSCSNRFFWAMVGLTCHKNKHMTIHGPK